MKKASNDLRRKQAAVAMLEHEQSDLVRRLTLAQESILERDTAIESLEKKYIDVEVTCQKQQRQLHTKDDEVTTKIKNKHPILVFETLKTRVYCSCGNFPLHQQDPCTIYMDNSQKRGWAMSWTLQ